MTGGRRRAVRAAGRPPVAIVVLAKHPVPGRVKTRLAAAIGSEAACDLYRAFVGDLAERLRTLDLPVWWAFTPSGAPFARLVGTRRCFPQRAGDLGARIDHAVRAVHAATGGAVIALGADMPHVSHREILRAARALARGTDVVLGPAADGGYWLIGLRVPARALFARIPWGTGRVLSATRRRCRALGLSCLELAPGFDVDGERDLAALGRLVRRGRPALPRSRAALARLTRRA